jgi:hypothetical protein
VNWKTRQRRQIGGLGYAVMAGACFAVAASSWGVFLGVFYTYLALAKLADAITPLCDGAPEDK